MVSLIPKESLRRLEEQFGAKFSKLNRFEVQALVTADIESYVDNARMRQMTGFHPTDITKSLQELVNRGMLRQDGRGRWTQYRLSSSSDKKSHSVHKGVDSVHKDSVHKSRDSVHKSGDSVHKSGDSVHSDVTSPEQWNRFQKIAQPALDNKRLLPPEMESVILRLCEGQWLTRKQISELVDRNADGLRARFLTPMVGHGILQLRYPDKPNRFDQAYRTATPIEAHDH